MRIPARVIVLLATLALVTAACGGDASPSPSDGSVVGPGEIPEILDFEAPLLDGGVFRGADLAGKDVAFWFWAPW